MADTQSESSGKMSKKDQLGVEIEVGDIVVVGSNSNVRMCKVYGFGYHGQPLSVVLIGAGVGKKGDWGTSYIIVKRGDRNLPELEEILNAE